MMKKIAVLSFCLALSVFCQADGVEPRTVAIDLKPQKLMVHASCEVIPGSQFGDDIQVSLANGGTGEVLKQLILENAQDIWAIRTCADFERMLAIPSSKWIVNTAPAFPLAVPSAAIYNFSLGKQHWLLVKDIGASTENEPVFHAFIWKNRTWQNVPDFFAGLSFYGFDERRNVITGFYEGGFFVKHTSSLSGMKLKTIKKEVWVDNHLVKTYSPDDTVVFDEQ